MTQSPPARSAFVPLAVFVLLSASSALRAQDTAPETPPAAPAAQPIVDRPLAEPPAQSTPPAARETPDPGQLLGRGRGLALTLEAAQQLALDNDFGLRIEGLSSDIARFNWRGSYGAFDWLFGASAGLSDREGPPQSVFQGEESNTQSFSADFSKPLATTGGVFGAHFDTVNTETNSTTTPVNPATRDQFTLSYTQPLLRGGWGRYATSPQREAELVYQEQLERERAARQRVLRDVSFAYWDLVSTREQLEVAESSLALAREQVSQNERRLEAGVGTEVEVLQAEAEEATREERRLFAEARTRQAADVLKQLIFPGTDTDRWETGLIPLTPLPEAVSPNAAPPWTGALAVALESRSELRQQRARIDQASERLLRRRSERNPALDLQLSATGEGFSGDSSQAFEDSWQYDYPTYTAALVFSFPLENRGPRYAEKAAWAELRAGRLVYDQIESQIVGEVREAVRQVTYQAEAVRAARKSLQLAERQLAAEQARYQEQLSTTFQVLEFQQDLALAMSSERAARASWAKALIALEAAQGRLGELPPR